MPVPTKTNESKVIYLIDRLAAKHKESLDQKVVSFELDQTGYNTISHIPKWEWEYSREQKRVVEMKKELYLRREELRASYPGCVVSITRKDVEPSHGKIMFSVPWEHDGTLYKLSLEKPGELTLNSDYDLVMRLFARIFNKIPDKNLHAYD